MAGTIKKDSVVVAVGTKKGGFLFHSADRRKWSVAGPFLAGAAAYHMGLPPRDGRTAYAAAPPRAGTSGPPRHRGGIGGQTQPPPPPPGLEKGGGPPVRRGWHLAT